MSELSPEFQSDHFDRFNYLFGLIEQLVTLMDSLYRENQRLEEQHKSLKITQHQTNNPMSAMASVPIINATLAVALRTSIIFFQFSIIEAIVNFLAHLTIQTNEGKYFTPKVKLTQPEVDFIDETVTFFDSAKGKEIQRPSYKRLEDRLEQIPVLFAKVLGQDYKLDKSDGNWQKFLELKELRDKLTHPKSKRVRPTYEQIFNGSAFIYWLCEKYFMLIHGLLYSDRLFPYVTVETSAMRLIAISYHATLKKHNIDSFIKKHEDLMKLYEVFELLRRHKAGLSTGNAVVITGVLQGPTNEGTNGN